MENIIVYCSDKATEHFKRTAKYKYSEKRQSIIINKAILNGFGITIVPNVGIYNDTLLISITNAQSLMS